MVATNARLTKVQATKLAQMAGLGMARTIYPVNTMFDGDIVFALSLGEQPGDVNTLGVAAAEAVCAGDPARGAAGEDDGRRPGLAHRDVTASVIAGIADEATATTDATCFGQLRWNYRDVAPPPIQRAQVQLARPELRQASTRYMFSRLGIHSAAVRIGRRCQIRRARARWHKEHQPLAALVVGHDVTAHVSSPSASSMRRCGTISPPILLKRERRSVMRRKPSSSSSADIAGDVPAVAQAPRRCARAG